MRYRPDIDGLRCLAILPVVIFHFFPSYMRGGFVGVDVFFVISGYLISLGIFNLLEREQFLFKDFYLRRARRLFPALVLVLMVSLVFGWFFLLPDEYLILGKHVFSGAFFIQNFVLFGEAGYFDVVTELKPLMHLWSLAVEEQFYLFYPILIAGLWGLRSRFVIIVLLTAISFVLSIFWIYYDSVGAFFIPWFRFWELLLGGLIAYIHFSNVAYCLERRLADFFSVLGFLLIVCSVFFIEKGDLFPGFLVIAPVFGACLIIGAGSGAWFNRVILSHPWFVLIGLISYPLYLWHWPVLVFSRFLEGQLPDGKFRLLLMFFSVFLAWGTYRFLEIPMRKLGVRFTYFLIGALFLCGFLGGCVYYFAGIPERYDAQQASVLNDFVNPYPNYKGYECSRVIGFDLPSSSVSHCSVSKASLPRIALVGDSHAGNYRDAFFDGFSDESVVSLVAPTCLPFSVMKGSATCKDQMSSTLDYLVSSTVEKVYLSGYWSYLMTGNFGSSGQGWRVAGPFSEKGADVFLNEARLFISTLIKAGKDVVFIMDVPDLEFDIKDCYGLKIWKKRLAECSFDQFSFEERVSLFDSVIGTLLSEFPAVEVYNPRSVFCDGIRCFAGSEFPYYFNGDHLNYKGALKALDPLFKGEEYR